MHDVHLLKQTMYYTKIVRNSIATQDAFIKFNSTTVMWKNKSL